MDFIIRILTVLILYALWLQLFLLICSVQVTITALELAWRSTVRVVNCAIALMYALRSPESWWLRGSNGTEGTLQWTVQAPPAEYEIVQVSEQASKIPRANNLITMEPAENTDVQSEDAMSTDEEVYDTERGNQGLVRPSTGDQNLPDNFPPQDEQRHHNADIWRNSEDVEMTDVTTEDLTPSAPMLSSHADITNPARLNVASLLPVDEAWETVNGANQEDVEENKVEEDEEDGDDGNGAAEEKQEEFERGDRDTEDGEHNIDEDDGGNEDAGAISDSRPDADIREVNSNNRDGPGLVHPTTGRRIFVRLPSQPNPQGCQSPRELTECPICCEMFPVAVRFKLRCDHSLCKSCVVQCIKKGLSNPKSFPPICLASFECQKPIDMKAARHLLSRDLRKKYDAVSEDWSRKYRINCATAGCHRMIPDESFVNNARFGKCRKCFEYTCRMCQQLKYKHRSKDSCPDPIPADTLLAAMDKDDVKRCPRCHHLIERPAGCSHMTCDCGHEFCWVCLVPYGQCDCGGGEEDDEGEDVEDEDEEEDEEDDFQDFAIDEHGNIFCLHDWINIPGGRCDGVCQTNRDPLFECQNCFQRFCEDCVENGFRNPLPETVGGGDSAQAGESATMALSVEVREVDVTSTEPV